MIIISGIIQFFRDLERGYVEAYERIQRDHYERDGK